MSKTALFPANDLLEISLMVPLPTVRKCSLLRVNVFHGNSHHVTDEVYFFLIRLLAWLAVTATIQRWIHTLSEIFISA